MSCMLSFFKRIYSAAKSCFTNSTDDPCSDLRNESSSQPSSSSQRIDGSETLCLNVSHTIQRNEHAMYRPREHVKRVILNSLQDEKDLFYLMRRLYVWQRNNITSLELDGCTITDPDTFLDTLALISPGSLKYLRIVNHTSNSAFPHTFTVCSQLTHFTYHVNSYNLTRNDKGNELDWETPLLVNELVPRTTPLRVDNSQVVTHCPNSMELIGFLEFLQRQQLHTLDWCDINLRDANSMVTVLNNYPGLNTLILRMDLTLDHSSCTALHSMHHLQALHLSHITLNYDLSLVTLLESFPALEDLMLCDLTLSDAIPKGSKDPERLRQIDLDNIKWNNACTDDAVTRLLRKCAKHSNLQVVSLCNLKGFTTQALERIAAISTLKSVEVELIEERVPDPWQQVNLLNFALELDHRTSVEQIKILCNWHLPAALLTSMRHALCETEILITTSLDLKYLSILLPRIAIRSFFLVWLITTSKSLDFIRKTRDTTDRH